MNYNSAKRGGLFLNEKLIHIASKIVADIHKFEMSNPDWNKPNTAVRQSRIAVAAYKSAPSPKLENLKYLFLYINEIDIDEWQGEQTDARDVTDGLIQVAIEGGIAGDNYPYFKRKVKSDLVLADYLRGSNVSESRLRNALNGLEHDYDALKHGARNYSNHVLRYDAIRTRNAHERKMRSLQGALDNKRIHGVVVVNPNNSRALGLGNKVRKALKFW